MTKFIKILIRTLILFIPAVILAALGIVGLISTVISDFINWVFNSPSYWDVRNEWFQFTQDCKKWYSFWLNGINQGDW